MNEAIYAVAISLVVFASLVALGVVGFGGYKIYKAMKTVADGLINLNDQMAGIPAILDGVRNICIDLSGSTVNVGKSVDKLRTSLFDKQTSDPRRDKEAMKEYSDEDAGREYNIQNLMRTHKLTYQQARDMTIAGIDEDRFFVGDE